VIRRRDQHRVDFRNTRDPPHTCEQVLDLLHVDLHVADLDGVLDTDVRGDDGGEDLLDDTRDDASECRVLDVCALGEPVNRQRTLCRP